MPLAGSTRLGSYEIVAAIRAVGMGEVYRAKDTKLGCDVALKILPASFTNDPERVARSRREAQVLASLKTSPPPIQIGVNRQEEPQARMLAR